MGKFRKYCPKCGSDDIYFADKGTPNDDCFECGACGVILPNDELTDEKMKQPAHTKGPWEAVYIKCQGYAIKRKEGKNWYTIADVYNTPSGTAEANAQLIACAPELLELLTEFVMYMDSDLSEAEQVLKKKAETLIAKAEGTK